jgi:zinc transport system ATP-binding protein
MATEPVISLRDVTFSYGSTPAVENASFAVAEREAVCVVGPNGGGKTTLVRLILGLLTPQRGEVRVFGLPPRQARPRIGYMPQHMQHDRQFPVTVMDIVLMGRLGLSEFHKNSNGEGRHEKGRLGRLLGWPDRADRRAALEALAQVGMEDLRRRPFAALSGGQRQRVLIARALCGKPDLLLLDEPTSNVDSLLEGKLLDLLGELNRHMTIVMVSHDLGFVSSLVENVICVNRRVVVHPTSQITGEAIHAIYGGAVRVVHHNEFSTHHHP